MRTDRFPTTRSECRRALRPSALGAFLAALLCLPASVLGQAPIQTPEEASCADAVYAGHLAKTLSDLALKYTGTTRWARQDMETLCRGTRAPQQPPTCFANAMVSDPDWSTGQQLRWELALQLCAGTNQASQTIGCFDQEKRQVRQSRPGEMTDLEIWRGAVDKCRRRQAAAPGLAQQPTFQQPGGQPVSGQQQAGQQQAFPTPGGQAQPPGQAPVLSQREQELLEKIKKLEEEKKKLQTPVPLEITEDRSNIRDFLGVRTFALEEYGSLMKGEPRQFKLQTEPNGLYTITAACDKNCKDVDLILLDSNGRQIMTATDKGPDAKPVLEISPGTSTEYSAQVMMQDCAPGPCSFGLFLIKDRTAFAVAALPRWKKTAPQVSDPKAPPKKSEGKETETVDVKDPNDPKAEDKAKDSKAADKAKDSKAAGDPKKAPAKPANSLTGVPYKTRAQASTSSLEVVRNSDHCVFLAENYIPWDYGNGKWPDGQAERLCRGTSNSAEPPRCFYRAMHEQGPHRDKYRDWTPELAMRLCAGEEKGERRVTNNADARISCFQWYLAREAHSADRPRNYLYWPNSGPKPDGRKLGVQSPGKARWEYAMLGCYYDRRSNPESNISPGSDTEEDILRRIRPGWEVIQACIQGVAKDVPSEKWDAVKARRLCTGTKYAKEPKECFVALTFNHGKRSDEAIELCAGTNDSDATVDCATRRGYTAESLRRSTSCRGNPPHWPEPTSR